MDRARKITTRRGESKLIVDARIVVDMQGISASLGESTLANIRQRASEGKGYIRAFFPLYTATAKQYRRAGVTVAGRRSRLRKTGRTLDEMSFKRFVAADGMSAVVIFTPGRDGERAPHVANYFRPFLGLNARDLKVIIARVYGVPLKVQKQGRRRRG